MARGVGKKGVGTNGAFGKGTDNLLWRHHFVLTLVCVLHTGWREDYKHACLDLDPIACRRKSKG